YLGNLPATRRGEEPVDLGIVPPAGVVTREVRKGIEPQSRTEIVFTGSLDDTPGERFALSSLAQVLGIKLREQLREERGGTYGVSVQAVPAREPRPRSTLSISFASAPDRVEELVAAVFAEIDSLRRDGAGERELAKVKETDIRERETDLRDNAFWLELLAGANRADEAPGAWLDLKGFLDQLTGETVRRAAQRYLDPSRYVRVTLLSETQAINP